MGKSEAELIWYKERWYAVWYEDGKRKRKSLRTTERCTADQELADLKTEKRPPIRTSSGEIISLKRRKPNSPNKD